jgi:hypothetical protein
MDLLERQSQWFGRSQRRDGNDMHEVYKPEQQLYDPSNDK